MEHVWGGGAFGGDSVRIVRGGGGRDRDGAKVLWGAHDHGDVQVIRCQGDRAGRPLLSRREAGLELKLESVTRPPAHSKRYADTIVVGRAVDIDLTRLEEAAHPKS